jgi:hypothetical protein
LINSLRKNLFLRLPSIEFQPEIVTNTELSSNKLKCELYTGNICRTIIGTQYISTSTQNQKDIEQNLVENLKYLTHNQFLSNECRQLLLPMICLFTYPICDNDRLNVRSICRRSCQYFQNTACPNLFSYQQSSQSYSNRKLKSKIEKKSIFLSVQILQNIPTCENLPPTSDDPSCINLDQTISARRNGKNFDYLFLNCSKFNSIQFLYHPPILVQ